MRRVFEVGFDITYLLFIFTYGTLMLVQAHGRPGCLLFGVMALTLGGGDIFHLVPRILQQLHGKEYRRAAGLGKWVTSVTSTVYYSLLYAACQLLQPELPLLWGTVLTVLAAVRIVLCCLPQNRWFTTHPPLRWGVLRNLPLLGIGGIVAVAGTLQTHPALRFLPLAVLLSFLFYIPVVLFAAKRPALGMLMIPKTAMYVWIQLMGAVAFAGGM